MRKKWFICLALCLIIPGLLFTVSCSKPKVDVEDTTKMADADAAAAAKAAADQAAAAKAAADAEAARQAALEQARLDDQQRQQSALQAALDNFVNTDIYFEFDSAVLSPEGQAILREKAAYLGQNANLAVVIEGHCDERGTNEYNMALGERRALAAQAFLINLGIDGARLQPVSYGEERPIEMGSGEASWARNRRAHFAIQ